MSYSWDKSTNPDFQYLFCEKNDNLIALQIWKSMRPGNDPFTDRHRVAARWLPTTAVRAPVPRCPPPFKGQGGQFPVMHPHSRVPVQNRQTVQSMRRSVGWTFEDNNVDCLFFLAIFASRRGGHTPFVQAREETSDTSAEAVKPDPGCSW